MSLKKEDLEERLVEASAESAVNDHELASISSKNNEKKDSPTFSPKAVNDELSKKHNVKVVVNSQKELAADNDNESTSCCETDCCCCNCWRENRFAIMLVFVLLVGLAVPLYILIRFAHFEFDFHKECVECFDGKADFVIFNQTSGECDFLSQNATYDSNNIVLDPNFCGAPHCQNLELLPGLRLVPYWCLAASAIFSIVLSAGVNFIKYNCYLPIKKRFVKWKWDEELVEENAILRLAEFKEDILAELEREPDPSIDHEQIRTDVKILHQLSIFLKTFGLTDPYFFVLLYLFVVAHLGFSIYEVMTNPTFAHLDALHTYETIYGLVLNGGSIEVFWFVFTMLPVTIAVIVDHSLIETSGWIHDLVGYRFLGASKELKELQKFLKIRKLGGVCEEAFKASHKNILESLTVPTDQFNNARIRKFAEGVCTYVPSIVTLPVLMTHILPGIVLFIPYWSWIFILLAIVFLSALMMRTSCSSMFLPSMAVLRLTGSFFILLLFPTIFNWSVLFYEGRTWSDVMTGEYRLRNTDCYFNALVNSIQIYNIGFVGLIFS